MTSSKMENVIDFCSGCVPRKIIEVDNATLAQLRKLRDRTGKYLWMPEPNYKDMPGTLMGIPISIAKGKCFQIRFIFADGHEHIVLANTQMLS